MHVLVRTAVSHIQFQKNTDMSNKLIGGNMDPVSDGYASEGGGVYNDITNQLPHTGVDLLTMGILGILLVLVGCVLAIVVKRWKQ